VSQQAARELLAALCTCERVLLTGPVEPDGDSLGACLALQRVLQFRGIRSEVAGAAGYRYAWMPGADQLVADELVAPHYDGVVVLDGDRHRLTPGPSAAFDVARVRGIIDHHASTRPEGYTHAWIEPDSASTCELVYQLAVAAGVPIDADFASLIYAGLLFDTGGFRYSNTTPATHRLAAELLDYGVEHTSINSRILMERTIAGVHCVGEVLRHAAIHHGGRVALGALTLADRARFGIAPGDTEGLVEALVHIQGVDVAALLIEQGPELVKVSFRSRGTRDVAKLAHSLAPSGGGHAKASGVSLPHALKRAEAIVLDALRGC